MRELSLFSGAGGGIYGTQLLGARVVAYVERDPYCQRVLRQRIADCIFEDAPIFDDVRTFDGTVWRGKVDLLTAGFPCQPFSVAGKGGADQDERNMWPSTARIIREVRPGLVFLENVPGLLAGSHGYFGRVLGELSALGYDAEWTTLSAGDCGAPHKRDRLWILAGLPHALRELVWEQPGRLGGPCGESAPLTPEHGASRLVADARRPGREERDRAAESVAPSQRRAARRCEPSALPNADGKGELQQGGTQRESRRRPGDTSPKNARRRRTRALESQQGTRMGRRERDNIEWWRHDPAESPAKSRVGRVAHGVADRSDRLRALGNGQVPAVVASAFRALHARLIEEV